MHPIEHFFMQPPAGITQVTGTYDPSLVFLSIFVAVVLSLLSLRMANTAIDMGTSQHRTIIIGTGAIALGSGIWTMHFIGMFAFRLPAEVHYNTSITLLSMLPATGAAWISLTMLTRKSITRTQLAGSGVIMGAGIGAMHYGGMIAIETPLIMRHHAGWFLLSIVVAVALAMLAIWIRFGLQRTKLNMRVRFWLSGLIMGSAIAGMHYTAMQAVEFYGTATQAVDTVSIGIGVLAVAISSVTLTIAMIVAAVNGLIHSRQLNLEIIEGRQRLEAIFNTAVDAIITINSAGTVQEFSHSAERMFGYKREEVVGKNVNMLMPDPYKTEHDGYLHRYLTTRKAHIIGVGREVEAQRKDGSIFHMRLAVGEVEIANRELLFVGLISDITDRKKLEKSLREEAIKAQQAAVAKSNFLANMSHEIRTPMNAIMGFAELLAQTDLTGQQLSHLNTIRQSSRSLLGLLNDILDSSKLESGRFELENIDFSLKVLASQIESTLSLSAHKKGLGLSIIYPDSMPEYFKGDGLRILQVLTNLVGNAIKFTEQGQVEVAFSFENNAIHIQVKDTGIGMTSQQTETIFEAFSQADASISRRFGGTGLGTTISRQLVELMGGSIGVESEPGKGSNFHVWLPLHPGEKPITDVLATIENLPSLNILIADDIEQNRELLTLTLRNHGHKVTAAVNGEEAFQYVQKQQFDVVLMDVHMPVVDGLKATRKIRQHEQQCQQAHLPIIALTASVMASDRMVARQAGMDGFAVKPLDIPQLFNEIGRVLKGEQEISSSVLPLDRPSQGIDWQRGISLWGSSDHLLKNIRAFLNNVQAKYPLPETQPLEVEILMFSLHGIKGAAGNLGLVMLSYIAAELENLVKTERIPQAQLRLPVLKRYLAKLQHHIATQLQPISAEHGNQPATSLSAPLLDTVITMLERNEMDDQVIATLMAVLQHKHRQQADALQAQLDNFEFDKAITLLKEWRQQAEENS